MTNSVAKYAHPAWLIRVGAVYLRRLFSWLLAAGAGKICQEVIEMTWLEHGRIQGGAIILSKPLPLPEGTEVTVRVEAASGSEGAAATVGSGFLSLPFFGMWADRADMKDSAAWVRQERNQWQQRTHRQD